VGATDPQGLQYNEDKERKWRKDIQDLFGAPSDKDAPLDKKIYSEKNAPIGLIFADETLWPAMRINFAGGGAVIIYDRNNEKVKRDIPRENAALRSLILWKYIVGLDINVFYIGNGTRGIERFLQDASKKGYGSVNLFFGHGGDNVNFDMVAELKNLKNPNNAAPPLFGISSCFAGAYLDDIPKENRIPNPPSNKGATIGTETIIEGTPMLEAVDKIIHDRMKAKEKIQLNIYFGEMQTNSFSLARRRFKAWSDHSGRYANWLWNGWRAF
jgi:hypothetical protein